MRAQSQTNKKSSKSSSSMKTAERSKPMESRTKKSSSSKSSSSKSQVRPSSKQSSMQKKQQEPEKNDTTFSLEAPDARQVSVVGCFNNWDPMANFLDSDGNGLWSCTLSIEPGEHEYRFIVDGMWCDDPDNMMRRSNGFGEENCVLVV